MMKTLFLFFLVIFYFMNCKKAIFDNLAEGASGILIGTNLNQRPAILISGIPSSLDEGNTAVLSIRLSQRLSSKTNLNLISDNPALLINELQSVSLELDPEDSTIDNNFTLFANYDSNQVSEEVKLTVSVSGLETRTFNIQINDKFTRLIQISGASNVDEEAKSSFAVNLGIKPDSDVTLTIESSDPNSVDILALSNLTFTSSNYNIPQIISYKINDIYNDNREYSFFLKTDTESKEFKVLVNDNDFIVKEIPEGQFISAFNPSIDVDPEKNTFVIAGSSTDYLQLFLFRCDLSGDNCSVSDISTGQPFGYAYFKPNLKIDKVNSKIFISASRLDSLALFRCSITVSGQMDGCNYNSILSTFSSGSINNTTWSRIQIYHASNPLNSKLFIVQDNEFSGKMDICNLNATSCSTTHMGNLTDIGGIGSRGTDIDSINGKIYSVFNGKTTIGIVDFFRIPKLIQTNLDGSGMITNTIGDIYENNILITPDVRVDTVNSKILVLGSSLFLGNKLYLSIIDINNSNYNFLDVGGNFNNIIYYPKLNIDYINKKLLILGYDFNGKLFLSHCNLNGSDCKYTDISKQQSIKDDINQPNFDSVIDPVNNRLLVVFINKLNLKINLIRFGLGGF